MARRSWDAVKAGRGRSAAARAGYDRARQAFEIGEQVRVLREEHGLSQRELAERIGSTQPAIARLEAGGVIPNLATLDRIAAAVGSALVIEFTRPEPSGVLTSKTIKRAASA
jgi:transcriptional regulator with XRE-family HTH domain